MDKKEDPYIFCLQETHLKRRDTHRLKVKGWKKIFHSNRDQKKSGNAILISDKIDFKTKAVKRDKEGHYTMIKGSIQEEDITMINIYAPNIGALQYVRWLRPRTSMAEKSYPTSEVRGSAREYQDVMAQEQPRGAALRPRSGAVAGRSYPISEVRGGSWEELPTSEVRGGGREEQPHVQGVVAVQMQEG